MQISVLGHGRRKDDFLLAASDWHGGVGQQKNVGNFREWYGLFRVIGRQQQRNVELPGKRLHHIQLGDQPQLDQHLPNAIANFPLSQQSTLDIALRYLSCFDQ